MAEDIVSVVMLDRNNVVQAEIGLENAARDFTSLSYVKKVSGWGSFSGAVIWGDSPYAEMMQPNYRIVVMRQPIGNINRIQDFAGFIRRVEYTTPASDIDTIQIWGRGIGSILGKYQIIPDSGSAYEIQTGKADDVVKAYVRHCCLEDPDRVFPNFEVAGDRGESEYSDTWEARYERLHEYTRTIRDQANDFDYMVTLSNDFSTFTFETASPQIGRDLRINNPEGNDPLIYSLVNGNMSDPRYWRVGFDGATEVAVLGQGSQEDRVIVNVRDTDLEETWGYHGIRIDRQDLDETGQLTAEGQAVLENQKPREGFVFQPTETLGTRYYTDWRLGDQVTGQYLDIEADFMIEEIRFVISSTQLEVKTPKLRQTSEIREITA